MATPQVHGHDARMRMPWSKSNDSQLDLLDESTPPADGPESCPAAMPRSVVAGLPLLVSIARLYEDTDNPRTELPEDGLSELTEDIRQRGILQPIVVHAPDDTGRYRIHFGARRWRAAKSAGLDQVPIVVRDAPADPYAQVAENQKRHGLTPLDLARFIRRRVEAGESNSEVARRLGMNLTTVAHHLALLELPPVLDDALRSGRCTSPRTLHELGKLHEQDPAMVQALLASDADITRATVSRVRSTRPASPTKVPSASATAELIAQAVAACDRLERALRSLDASDPSMAVDPEISASLARVAAIVQRWLQGSDRPTRSQAER